MHLVSNARMQRENTKGFSNFSEQTAKKGKKAKKPVGQFRRILVQTSLTANCLNWEIKVKKFLMTR
jgi:hypothetical protein